MSPILQNDIYHCCQKNFYATKKRSNTKIINLVGKVSLKNQVLNLK